MDEIANIIMKSFSKKVEEAIRSLGGKIVDRDTEEPEVFQAETPSGANIAVYHTEYENAPKDIYDAVIMEYQSRNIDAMIDVEFYDGYIDAFIGNTNIIHAKFEILDKDILVKFKTMNPFTGKPEKYDVCGFLELLEKLSTATWPATSVPIILKYSEDRKMLYDENKIYYVSNETDDVVETVFVTPLGEIIKEKEKFYIVVAGKKKRIKTETYEFYDFARNYILAKKIAETFFAPID